MAPYMNRSRSILDIMVDLLHNYYSKLSYNFFFFRLSAVRQVHMSIDSIPPVVVPFLSFLYPSSIIQSISFCLGLPFSLFLSILPSIISLCKESPLVMCPIQFFCLVLIISIKDLFSSTIFRTSSFVLCSVQLILSILLHTHISKASIRLTSFFLII